MSKEKKKPTRQETPISKIGEDSPNYKHGKYARKHDAQPAEFAFLHRPWKTPKK